MKKSRLFTTLTVSLGLLFALSSTAFAATTRYEAESAKVNGSAKITPGPVASGGKFVGDNNKIGADSIDFTVNVTTAGTYKLTFGYATMNEGASDTILVNGAKAADLAFDPPTDHWLYNAPAGSEKTLDLKVTLKVGDNDINVGPNNGSVNIDYIDVSDVSATPTATATTNPKTGDVGVVPYLALMGISSIGLIVRKKKLNN